MAVCKHYPPSPKNNQHGFLEKFCEAPPNILKWIGVKSLALFWVKLMDKEVNFIWRPYINVASSFSLASLDEDVGVDMNSRARYNPHRVRCQFGYDQGVPSENPVLLDHEHSVTSFILQTRCSHLNKTSPLAMIQDNSKAGLLTQRACQYWNEITVRIDISDSFEDDLSNDYESAAVPIAGSSSVAIEQRSSVDAGDEMPSTNHNDFIAQLTISSVVGNPLLIILVVVLMNMQETQVTSLTEEWLFRWRDAMKDLRKANLKVSFVLCYIRDVATSSRARNTEVRDGPVARSLPFANEGFAAALLPYYLARLSLKGYPSGFPYLFESITASHRCLALIVFHGFLYRLVRFVV
ncbi:hypothetical protein CFP56_033953 [Quercus suber]|uniref:Uncharacterized protein n=1 Tax=Quercus suber TaxID=58331 RepID=A0AAW0JDA5_QUESU